MNIEKKTFKKKEMPNHINRMSFSNKLLSRTNISCSFGSFLVLKKHLKNLNQTHAVLLIALMCRYMQVFSGPYFMSRIYESKQYIDALRITKT